jgi:DNA-binding protein HU-beta
MIVNRSQLVQAVTESTQATRRSVEDTVEVLFETIISEVRSGRKVTVVGFGTFTPTVRAPRVGRNPRTGAVVPIPASRVVRFATGSAFKSALTPKEGVSMAVKKAAAKKAVRKAPAKKTAAKRTTAKKTAAKKAVKKRATKKTAARKAPARKTAAKRAPAKRAVKKRATKKTAARKAPARKTAAKRAPAKRAVKKRATKKTAARKAPARKAARRTVRKTTR